MFNVFVDSIESLEFMYLYILLTFLKELYNDVWLLL